MRKLKIVYIINFICLIIILITNILNFVYKISKSNKFNINIELIKDNNYKEYLSEINNLKVFDNFKNYENNTLVTRIFFLSISFISGGYIFLQQINPYINSIVCNLFYSVLNYFCIILNCVYAIVSLILILRINKIKKVEKNINDVMNNVEYNNIIWEKYGNLNNKCELNIIINIIIIIFCFIVSFLCLYGLINIEYRYSDKGTKDEDSDISDSQEKK
jgi:hypothetical protein